MTKFYYEVVPASEVPQEKRVAAYDMQKFCEADLNLEALDIVWIRQCGAYGSERKYAGTALIEQDARILGQAKLSQRCFYVNADQDKNAIKITVAHEHRHFFQHVKKAMYIHAETDAEIYAREAVGACYLFQGNPARALKLTDKRFIADSAKYPSYKPTAKPAPVQPVKRETAPRGHSGPSEPLECASFGRTPQQRFAHYKTPRQVFAEYLESRKTG